MSHLDPIPTNHIPDEQPSDNIEAPQSQIDAHKNAISSRNERMSRLCVADKSRLTRIAVAQGVPFDKAEDMVMELATKLLTNRSEVQVDDDGCYLYKSFLRKIADYRSQRDKSKELTLFVERSSEVLGTQNKLFLLELGVWVERIYREGTEQEKEFIDLFIQSFGDYQEMAQASLKKRDDLVPTEAQLKTELGRHYKTISRLREKYSKADFWSEA